MTKEEKLTEKQAQQEKKAQEKAAKAKEKAKLKAMTPEERKAYKAEQKEIRLKEFEAHEVEHAAKVAEKAEKIESATKLKGWKKFWFKFGQSKFCQWFRITWVKFKYVHPVAAKWVYQLFYFIVFSQGVTIWQYLLMLFLPLAFTSLADTAFVWPQVELWTWSDGTKMIWGIFNEPAKALPGGGFDPHYGLGNFIAFEIAVFTAQCINFPLQRNITFRSHGNPWWQAMWYFVGWVLISIFVNAVWGFLGPICDHLLTSIPALTTLLKTVLTGGLSMVIFFFIFKIIFPEGEPKKTTEEIK